MNLINNIKRLLIPEDKPSQEAPSIPSAYHPTYWDGIQRTRLRKNIPYTFKSARSNNTWTRKEMASISRYLYDNDGLVHGAINDMARYSFPLSPQAITDDPYWNLEAESIFKEWSHSADISGRYGFDEMQRLLSIAIDRDGDAGVLFVRYNGLKLQMIESHRVGDFIEQDSGFMDGVRTNRYGKPIEYLIADESIHGEFYPKSTKYRRVPANAISWLLDPERAEQQRGLPAIKHAINHIRDIKEILEHEKTGVKNLSTIAAVLESETGEADPDAWNTSEIMDEATRLTVNDIQSGSIPVLKKGEKLSPFSYNRPSPTFQGFLEFIIREFSVGMGLPYEFLWHPAGITGPAQRFIMGKAQRRFRERQRLFGPFMRKVWAVVISDAIANKKLKSVPDWYKCRIQAPAELTIDAGREAAQEREDVLAGLMTMREHFGKRGMDWQSECQQKAKEMKYILEKSKTLAEETGVNFDTIVNLLIKGEFVGNAPEPKEDEDNTPDKDSTDK
jgi:capsid protein